MRYDPRSYLKDPKLEARLEALDWRARCSIAEVLVGNMKKHVVYAVRAAPGAEGPQSDRVARAEGPATIPMLPFHDGKRLAETSRRRLSLTIEFDGLPLTLPLPRLAPAMLARIDGRTNLGAMHAALREADSSLTWEAFAADFDALSSILTAANVMMLATPPSNASQETDS